VSGDQQAPLLLLVLLPVLLLLGPGLMHLRPELLLLALPLG
jgi:hypothetical protein